MPLELLAFLVLVLVLAVWLVVRQQNLRLRHMQHRERLAAIDSGSAEGPTTVGAGLSLWILAVLPVKLRRGHLAPR